MEDYKNLDGTVKIKRVIFHNGSADYIISLEQWNNAGGYRGFLKERVFTLGNVLKVDGGNMTQKELDDLPEWDG